MEHPLRITMLAACPFPTPQGTQVFVRHLATELGSAGHTVRIVCYGHGHTEPGPGAAAAFQVHRAPGPRTGTRSGPHPGKPVADLGLLYLAARIIRRHGCDVLHAHNVEGQAVGILLRALCQVPLLYHCHNAMEAELPTYAGSRPSAALARCLGRALDRRLPRAADGVITFDAAHKARHVAHGVRGDRVHVIPPGIQAQEMRHAGAERVARLQASLGPGPWVLYAGNPDAYQNLDLLWAAWKRVRTQGPAPRLLVVSHHEPRAFGPPRDGVHVLRCQDPTELRALYGLCQLAVCPRALDTGAPIKLLNYLAAGLPVVACQAAAQHLLPPQHGSLVACTPAAFAAGILAQLAAPRRTNLPQSLQIERQVGAYAEAYAATRKVFATAFNRPVL